MSSSLFVVINVGEISEQTLLSSQRDVFMKQRGTMGTLIRVTPVKYETVHLPYVPESTVSSP